MHQLIIRLLCFTGISSYKPCMILSFVYQQQAQHSDDCARCARRRTFLGKFVLNWYSAYSCDSQVLSLKRRSVQRKLRPRSTYLYKRYQNWKGNFDIDYLVPKCIVGIGVLASLNLWQCSTGELPQVQVLEVCVPAMWQQVRT